MDIPQTAWGWLLIWDFFLAGTGAGAYLSGTLAEFLGEKHRVAAKIGTFLSAPLVIGGVLFLMLDLGRPDRFMFVFNNMGSLIAIGSMFITAFLVVSVIHIGFWIWPFKFLEKANAARRTLGVIGAILALGVMIYPGLAMSLTTVPFWMTGLLPLLFIGVATLCGIAATTMVLAVYHERSTGEAKEKALASLKALATPMLLLGVFVLVVLAFFTVASGNVAATAVESTMLLTTGPFAVLFWGGLVIAGLILPIVLLGMGVRGTSRLPVLAAVSSFLFLTGGLVARYLVVSAGVSPAWPPYSSGQEVYFQTYPPQIVASFITQVGPGAFDYAVVGLFFLILAATYFIATKIVPAPKVVTAKKV
jgi:polysulfide reductase chain C